MFHQHAPGRAALRARAGTKPESPCAVAWSIGGGVSRHFLSAICAARKRGTRHAAYSSRRLLGDRSKRPEAASNRPVASESDCVADDLHRMQFSLSFARCAVQHRSATDIAVAASLSRSVGVDRNRSAFRLAACVARMAQALPGRTRMVGGHADVAGRRPDAHSAFGQHLATRQHCRSLDPNLLLRR